MTNRKPIDAAIRRTFVIIPVFNEEASIGHVLSDIPDGVAKVVVADNGSQDASAKIARQNGAVVAPEPQRGYGKACLTGIAKVRELATEMAIEPDNAIVVFLDGDYSDHPEEMQMLLAPIASDEADFVVGSRMTGARERGAMPFQATFGNWLACTLMRFFWGAKFTDLGPFRAIRLASLEQLKMRDENFGWTIEMQIKAVQQQLRYREIPVSYRCRIGQSKISGTISGSIRAGYKILYVIFKYRLFGS